MSRKNARLPVNLYVQPETSERRHHTHKIFKRIERCLTANWAASNRRSLQTGPFLSGYVKERVSATPFENMIEF